MRYQRVDWHHDLEDEPVVLFSEIGSDNHERRKVDQYRDGRLDFADNERATGSTLLGEPWDLVLGRSSLDTLENQQNYVLVLVGARPGLGISEWWNKAAITVVPAEP